jgi:hypothetical protein
MPVFNSLLVFLPSIVKEKFTLGEIAANPLPSPHLYQYFYTTSVGVVFSYLFSLIYLDPVLIRGQVKLAW